MKNIEIITLKNGIKVILKENVNTPRVALNMFIKTGIIAETVPGMASLAGRLLLQGTKTRDAEALANELDENAIDISTDSKQDYVKLRSVCLNEDFEKTIELMGDIVLNSTFKNFKKELKKFKGEMEVDLDSPKVKAMDNLIKNIYPAPHPYGNTHTRVLEALNQLAEENVKQYHYSNLSADRINIIVVGCFDKDEVIALLEKTFGDIESKEVFIKDYGTAIISEKKIVKIAQKDAAQAQIIQGWIVPNIMNKDYPVLMLMNTILGASGLSSRLFVELRDKKGLAYHVRSSYEPLAKSGNFTVYIGTAPENINTCIEGFEEEINKLKTVLVSDEELSDAKNNILGKRAFFQETNAQQAHFFGFYDISGLGVDFEETLKEKIKGVTSEEIKAAANNYLSPNSIISILAPEEYLNNLK